MRVVRSPTLLAAAALALAASASAQQVTVKSPAQYEREFADWMARHHLTFSDALEFARRLENYIANDLYIMEQNLEAAWTGITLDHNSYSALSHDEFRTRMLGYVMPEGYLESRLAASGDDWTLQNADVPESIDWLEKGAVTPVKNQGMCGSCWAFSATGAIEGAAFVSSGKLPNLSEQELVDCDHNGDMGCNGGLMDHAFEWVEQNGGICSTDEYEYKAKQGVCQKCQEVVTVSGFQDVPSRNEKALQAAVAQQPVSVAIEADQRAFQFYKSGVFNLTCGTRLDHGVLAVGYGEDDNGQKYWKVKNSWGANWGEHGYIRLSREANGPSGQCGIAMVPSYPFATLISKEAAVEAEEQEVPTESFPEIERRPVSLADLFSSAKISQCGDVAKSIIHFDELDITPKAPQRGQPISFFGKGDATKDFSDASFKLQVKLAGLPVYGHSGKLCGDTHVPLPLGLGDIEVHGFACPVKTGKFSDLKVDVNLPAIAPSGNYEIQLVSKAEDADGAESPLFCVHVALDLTDGEATAAAKSRVYEPLAEM